MFNILITADDFCVYQVKIELFGAKDEFAVGELAAPIHNPIVPGVLKPHSSGCSDNWLDVLTPAATALDRG